MLKKKKNVRRSEMGFTIIESIVVLFIIGVLSATAALGFSRANREKIVEQASRKVSAEMGKIRDASFLGQKINDIFPCGYALSVKKNDAQDGSFSLSYTSGTGMDRLSVIDEDKICDEKINDKLVTLSNTPDVSAKDLALSKARITKIDGTKMGLGADLGCLTILFSAPRQGSYYCEGVANACPPASCTFKNFSEDGSQINERYFDITFSTSEALVQATTKKLRIYASGNTETIYE